MYIYTKHAYTVLYEHTRYAHIQYICTHSNTFLYTIYTVGWVNFSEFEITVCGSCKMSKKLN